MSRDHACLDCENFEEFCCDYGLCRAEAKCELGTRPRLEDALRFMSDNMVDGQEECSNGFFAPIGTAMCGECARFLPMVAPRASAYASWPKGPT